MKQATTILEQRKIEIQLAKEDSLQNLTGNLWPESNQDDKLVENQDDKTPPRSFPMPLGIDRIRVDIRTGLLSTDPVFSLPVVIRGTSPREKPQIISPDLGKSQEAEMLEPADQQKQKEGDQVEQIGKSEPTHHLSLIHI